MKKPVVCKKVYYASNEEAGLEPYCYECTSHKPHYTRGYLHCYREGFEKLHKWVYYKATGEKPDVVKQLCNNLICLNIAHMKAFTIEEANAQLPLGKNGHPNKYGCNSNRRIKDQAVLDQIHAYVKEGRTNFWIARKMYLYPEVVMSIVNDQTYRKGV